jgi:acetoacetyl-CoA synthetase
VLQGADALTPSEHRIASMMAKGMTSRHIAELLFLTISTDSTLNRNGVRMGSADIYHVVEKLSEIRESLVLGIEYPNGGYWMPLFVVLADGAELDDELRRRIRMAIRDGASAKHVPDDVIAVAGI